MGKEAIQLELFGGLVLTSKQQEEVNYYIKRMEIRANKLKENHDKIALLLDEAGFVEGVDYVNTSKTCEVTKTLKLGFYFDNEDFTHETTYMDCVGGVNLIVNVIKDGGMIKQNVDVNREKNKLMCYNITDQCRYYKPSSLLVKFNEYNSRKNSELDRRKKERLCLDYTITKYQRLYPEAKVKEGVDFHRESKNYKRFPIVEITFKSGSSISFKLGYGYELDKERLHRRDDTQSETISETLERFNNQKIK
tara:strand:+ start:120 stop:869 length:750 start_codon:yes stop_codon:yes gene_type:complete